MKRLIGDNRLAWARRLTGLLIVFAYANSYRHGVSWALSHSPAHTAPFWACTIASFPEILVGLIVLLWPYNGWNLKTVTLGIFSIGWTLFVNGAAAAPGASGLFIAVSPALVSLAGMWLMHGESADVPRETTPAETVSDAGPEPARPDAVSEPETPEPAPVTNRPKPRKRAAKASQTRRAKLSETEAVEWALTHDETPDVPSILSHTGLSRAAAYRVIKASNARRETQPQALKENQEMPV